MAFSISSKYVKTMTKIWIGNYKRIIFDDKGGMHRIKGFNIEYEVGSYHQNG